MKRGVLILIAVLLIATSCGNGSSNESSSSDEVIIGNQVWMNKNLDVSNYRNGDIIPQVQDKNAWANLTTGAWCYYDNDSSNRTKYGKLYNWYAVNDPRGLAPNGYHIPTETEWNELSHYLGGRLAAGKKMKSASGWYINDIDSTSQLGKFTDWLFSGLLGYGNGTNSSGFSGLPGGYRRVFGDFSGNIGYHGGWWSSSEADRTAVGGFYESSWIRSLSYNDGEISRIWSYQASGHSVRCIKD